MILFMATEQNDFLYFLQFQITNYVLKYIFILTLGYYFFCRRFIILRPSEDVVCVVD